MKFEKRGLIYNVDGSYWWNKDMAYIPVPVYTGVDVRIFFSSKAEDGNFRIGFIDVDKDDFTKINYVSPEPIAQLGDPGTFDEHGMIASCVAKNRQKGSGFLLMYVGWQRLKGNLRRLLFSSGLMSSDLYNFERATQSPAPMFERNNRQLYMASVPWVVESDDGLQSAVYYIRSNKLITIHDNLVPTYQISVWFNNKVFDIQGEGVVPKNDTFAIGRPTVYHDNKIKMFYSKRRIDKGYILDYAESDDLINYRKREVEGLELSDSGWDSEMMCFPSYFSLDGRKYIFYNGNDYGKTGFGYAELIGE